MELVDTHCHLQFDKLAADEVGVIKRAESASVKKLICVGTSIADSQQCVNIAGRYDNVWASVGAHPHDGKDFPADGTDQLLALLKKPKVVAVGEIGLDYYKHYVPHADQLRILRQQIEVSLPSGLPYIFHVRDAWQDFWAVLDNYPAMRGVIHSFSAGQSELAEVLKRGLYIGLNGIMTFTKDADQLSAAKTVPLAKLLLETDAPFLTPAPNRGQVCEPKHIKDIAQFLAELRGESIEELATATTRNAGELFGI